MCKKDTHGQAQTMSEQMKHVYLLVAFIVLAPHKPESETTLFALVASCTISSSFRMSASAGSYDTNAGRQIPNTPSFVSTEPLQFGLLATPRLPIRG
eukprot:6192779-Pleurochrysis_carterae.AAC.4